MHDNEPQIIASLECAAKEQPAPERTVTFEELAALLEDLQPEVDQEARAIEQCSRPT